MTDTEPDPHAQLLRFHAAIDRAAGALAEHHRARLECRRGCPSCCVDGITVFAIEAERIRREAGERLAEASPHPAGACAFLDGEGACRIYEQRPYVCRTQGLPLRWIEDDDDGGVVEHRDICPLNDEGEPITELAEADCWTLGPAEARLREIQLRFDGTLARVALRDLFRWS